MPLELDLSQYPRWPWMKRRDECERCNHWRFYRRDPTTGKIKEEIPERCDDPDSCTYLHFKAKGASDEPR